MVVDGSVADFKTTSLRFLDRADGLVVTSGGVGVVRVPAALIAAKPRFEAPAPEYRSEEILHAMRFRAQSARIGLPPIYK